MTSTRPWNTPYAWAGPPGMEQPTPLSLLDLIAAGNLDEYSAAILWVLMRRRASMIVASMPQRAGKTATLTALADLLPDDVERVYLRGSRERFEFVGQTDPPKSMLLVNELSDHLPFYLWGKEAAHAIELLKDGYALAATMHADSPQQVMGELAAGLGAAPEVLGLLTAVVNLEVRRDPGDPWGEPMRRVSAITVVEQEGHGLAFSELCRWDERHDVMIRHPSGPRTLAGRLGLDPADMEPELVARAHFLIKLRMSGERMDRPTFARAARTYAGRVAR